MVVSASARSSKLHNLDAYAHNVVIIRKITIPLVITSLDVSSSHDALEYALR